MRAARAEAALSVAVVDALGLGLGPKALRIFQVAALRVRPMLLRQREVLAHAIARADALAVRGLPLSAEVSTAQLAADAAASRLDGLIDEEWCRAERDMGALVASPKREPGDDTEAA